MLANNFGILIRIVMINTFSQNPYNVRQKASKLFFAFILNLYVI